jgi:hypothetical protein
MTSTKSEPIAGCAPMAFVGAQSTDLERSLAQALEEMRASPHSDDDPDDSNRPILIEALAWVSLAALVWLAVAISL